MQHKAKLKQDIGKVCGVVFVTLMRRPPLPFSALFRLLNESPRLCSTGEVTPKGPFCTGRYHQAMAAGHNSCNIHVVAD
eukprot:2121317-Amphidinium_carterae.1